MVTAATKCPKCGCHDFASPREAPLDADITCLECGYICTVKQALDAGRAESGTESAPLERAGARERAAR
jgi:hypothetical protein